MDILGFLGDIFKFIIVFIVIAVVGFVILMLWASKKAEEQKEIEKKERELKEEEQQRKEAEEKNKIELAKQKEMEEREKRNTQKKLQFNKELNSIPKTDINIAEKADTSKGSIEQIQNVTFSRITKKTNVERIFPFVVIDVETTGLHHERNDIIEVSAIKYESCFIPDSCFTTMCNPGVKIPKRASDINHITDEMVENAPSFNQISASLNEYIKNCNIVGHNLYFDLKFLCANGIDFSEKRKYFDTLELAKIVYGRGYWYNHKYETKTEVYNFKLDTLCEFTGALRDDAHRSLSDCLATGKLFETIVNLKTDE